MSFETGRKLAHYEILEPIGQGGMGEVYRARDSKLGRDVAIKVLPDEFDRDEERLRRFQREAKVLASLNHPNIASIHGLEEWEGTHYLVLELVEGETLAERIARGPIPVEEALAIATKIAEALEEAHEGGIVHRDLKPANIKLTPDDKVKVLDFGLAKAFAEEMPEGDSSMSPTITRDATRVGVILGTAAYMSPEQTKGKAVDKRTDIFAFGIVLYEMLTGKRAFAGEDVSDVLAAIIRAEPNWKSLPSALDPRLQSLLRRCLRKDRKRRVQAIGDVRVEIEDIQAEPTSANVVREARQAVRRVPVAAALLFGGIVAVAVWMLKPEPEPARRVVRVAAALPSAGLLDISSAAPDVDLAITPDGTRIVYPVNVDGQRQLVVRPLDELEATPLVGVDVAGLAVDVPRGPFISPDGRWVGYFDKGGAALRKVSILGGPPVTISESPGQPAFGVGPRGASWGPDDTILFGTNAPSGLWRVPAGGGEPEEVTHPDNERENHLWPEFLPGGDGVLFTIVTASVESAQIAALSLSTGEIKVIVPGGSNPRYARTGHIVYGVDGALRAVGFDAARLTVTSDPVPVLDGVVTKATGAADFAISRDGSLVYVHGSLQGDDAGVGGPERKGRSDRRRASCLHPPQDLA